MVEGMTGFPTLADDLRLAVSSGLLTVAYQPLFDLSTDPRDHGPVAVEALCRWDHAVHGAIGPDLFIPLAESENIVSDIDDVVLSAAAAQVAEWQREGHDLSLSVNVSPTHVSPSFASVVVERADETGLRPGTLTVEVTETPSPQLLPTVVEILPVLRSAGVGVSLDDFGGGDTTMAMLDQLPIDEIKIDRSLTQRRDAASEDAIAGVVTFAKRYGWRVVAEGIETMDDFERARRLGCDRGQGFLLGAPMSADRLGRLLSAAG
jgi:EAL domain-containing protein (putative c-di-GMP-specific phosphodiesterase class I)